MASSLLIAGPGKSWREYLDANLGSRDLILLDPAETRFGAPGRVCLVRGGKVVAWRFIGSLDPLRAPHVVIAALAGFLKQTESAAVQCFPYVPTPLNRQTCLLLAQLLQPEEILVETTTDLDPEGWPVGPEAVSLRGDVPDLVNQAQRKARWLELIESSTEHRFPFRSVAIEGARLGAGRALSEAELEKIGMDGAQHAEICGSTLFAVYDEEPPEPMVARLLDAVHAKRAVFAAPHAYRGLLCSFARQSGEDFAIGTIQDIDFKSGEIVINSPAVPQAPVRILRIGSLRIDASGNEIEELRAWQV